MQDRILEILTKTNITIEEIENIKEYLDMLEDNYCFLLALEAAGVDNWYGYEEACRIYSESEEE